MNFKEIVQKVKLHSGFQGTIASVEATDYTEYLAEAVRSSWVDLQNQREDWKFMWMQVTFSTVVGTHSYADDTILTGESYTVAKWKRSALYRNGIRLTEIDWDTYWENKTEFESQEDSQYFVIREYTPTGLILPTPSEIASITGEFYRTPQLLSSNTDVPLLPVEFHYLLVWKALEDVASYLGNPSIYERHSWKADILENKLMRSQVPAKKIRKKPFYRSNSN